MMRCRLGGPFRSIYRAPSIESHTETRTCVCVSFTLSQVTVVRWGGPLALGSLDDVRMLSATARLPPHLQQSHAARLNPRLISTRASCKAKSAEDVEAQPELVFRSFQALGRYLKGLPPLQPDERARVTETQMLVLSAHPPGRRKKAEAGARRVAAAPHQYRGLGVRTWADVDRLLVVGGWHLVSTNSNEKWRRTATKEGCRPLEQHLFLGISPSDAHHGPQKAATTMRRFDVERANYLKEL